MLAGFGLALAAAWVAVEVRQRLTSGPDAQASAGMYAFGDFLLGCAVFCVVGIVPLAAALYWLRPVAVFWRSFSYASVVVALTGPLLLGVIWLSPPGSGLAMLGPLRVLAMPVCGALWFTSGTFAPEKMTRRLLWGAAALEFAGFGATVLAKIVLPLAR